MIDEERIARAFHVPYWIAFSLPRPSWVRRPVWRFLAWKWSR